MGLVRAVCRFFVKRDDSKRSRTTSPMILSNRSSASAPATTAESGHFFIHNSRRFCVLAMGIVQDTYDGCGIVGHLARSRVLKVLPPRSRVFPGSIFLRPINSRFQLGLVVFYY